MKETYFKKEIDVQWGEMDAAQHINNTEYLRWAESARIGFYSKLKAKVLSFEGIGIILGWQDCKYIFPITYPDVAIVTYDVLEIKTDRIKGVCKIYSKKHDRIAAISENVVVAYDYATLKKANVPEAWREELVGIYGEDLLS